MLLRNGLYLHESFDPASRRRLVWPSVVLVVLLIIAIVAIWQVGRALQS